MCHIMRLSHGDLSIHKDVQLNSIAFTDASGVELTNALDTSCTTDDLAYLLLYFRREGLFCSLVKGWAQDTPSHMQYEEAYDGCGQWL